MNKITLPAAAFMLAMAAVSWAAVPAPPVNQYLGLGDTTFNSMAEADCRTCHNQTPPEPYPVDPTYLPDRHHLLVDTPIPTPPDPTDVPVPDADGDGVADANYDCLNCHTMTFNSGTGTWELDPDFRDCTQCHKDAGIFNPSVHHRTTKAQGGDCAFCHGSFVDNGLLDANNDGNLDAMDWVPTYIPSLVTPWPSKKPNGDDTTTNVFGEKAGSCKFCHSNDTGLEGPPVVEDTGVFGPVLVFTNSETHHNTGLATHDKCAWCHNSGGPPDSLSIRSCENCHGIPSLHNIQFAGQDFGSPNNDGTVNPGAEPAGFGHIGSQDDCWGCHGFSAASAPNSGPVIPGLYNLSASSVSAGSSIILSGTAFINKVQNPMTGAYDITLASQVILTDADGFQTTLAPVNVSGESIEVDIPASLPAGSYQIAAQKALKLSNPLNLAITPELAVTNATCAAGLVNISGSGFGSYLAADNSGTRVSATVTYKVVTGKGKSRVVETVTETLAGDVVSWSDSAIESQFPACPDEVTADTVFDVIAAAVIVDTPVRCSDYSDEGSCSADATCAWNDKKGTCKEVGGGGGKNK